MITTNTISSSNNIRAILILLIVFSNFLLPHTAFSQTASGYVSLQGTTSLFNHSFQPAFPEDSEQNDGRTIAFTATLPAGAYVLQFSQQCGATAGGSTVEAEALFSCDLNITISGEVEYTGEFLAFDRRYSAQTSAGSTYDNDFTPQADQQVAGPGIPPSDWNESLSSSANGNGMSAIGQTRTEWDYQASGTSTSFDTVTFTRAWAVRSLGTPTASSICAGSHSWVFRLSEEATISIEGLFSEPEIGITQRVPRLPSAPAPNGGFSFRGAPSGDWMDPETTFAYDFVMDGDSKFTGILNFPTGFSDKFMVSVGDTTHGPFTSSESVDFQTLSGFPVSGFRVSGITPSVDADDPVAFPIRLEFDTETADFTMTPLSTPFVEIKPLGNESFELIFEGILEQATGLNLPDPWQEVSGATSPFIFTPQPENTSRFWRATKEYPAPPAP